MRITKQAYDWGTLVTLRSRSGLFTAVLHPEHRALIRELDEGAECWFTTEDNARWRARRLGDAVLFTRGNRRFVVDAEALLS